MRSLPPFVTAVVGIVALFLVLYAIRLGLMWNRRTWMGNEPYRLLIAHKQNGGPLTSVEVMSVWPDTKKVISVSIPAEAFVGVVGGYGAYRIAALEELGRIEQIDGALLQDTIGFLLGIPINRVVWQTTDKLPITATRNQILREGLTGKRSLDESLAIGSIMSTIAAGEIDRYDFSLRNVLQEQATIDGSMSWVFNAALVDRFASDTLAAVWRDAAMTQVAAINASGKSQLASSWSRYIRLGGYDLVSVTDQSEQLETTQLLFSSEQLRDSEVGKTLRTLFPLGEVRVGNTSLYRSQVAILFGADSWKWLNNRDFYLQTKKH
jgi:hypothetical protein